MSSKHSNFAADLGKLPEWSNGADSKSAIRLAVSGVRIPHFPQRSKESRRDENPGGSLSRSAFVRKNPSLSAAKGCIFQQKRIVNTK